MDKFTYLSQQVADIYEAKGVSLKLVSESVDITSWYVEPDQTRRASTILDNVVRSLVNRNRCCVGVRYGLPQGGALIAVSERRLTDSDYRPMIAEARRAYGELSRKLDDITIECMTSTGAVDAGGGIGAGASFFGRIGDFKKKAKSKRKDTKGRIQEALDGLATPDDIQPEESLRGLFRAMRDSGLTDRLPQAGIKWHIPANKHSITFLRAKVPVLQLNLGDLNDDKTLTSTLLSLEAMASGEAPQANEVTAEYIKQLAAKVRDKERQLSDLASKHAPGAIAAAKAQQIQQQALAQVSGKQAGKPLSGKPQAAAPNAGKPQGKPQRARPQQGAGPSKPQNTV